MLANSNCGFDGAKLLEAGATTLQRFARKVD
jgi:hypothetical protein